MMRIVKLIPGRASLADWREIYGGASPVLDAGCRPAIEAAANTIEAIIAGGEPVYGVNTGFGKLASARIGDADLAALQRNVVLASATGVGEPLPVPVTRLLMALKLASLAQGASGVSGKLIDHLCACFEKNLVPVIPSQGSVGASGDLAPLAHMAAALMGIGEFVAGDQRIPAGLALANAGLPALVLGPKEGLALINGTQASTALALAALFETERAFQSALITGALATDAARGSDGPFDSRVQGLRRHPGQAKCADALRALMEGSAIRASHRTNDARVQDPYCLRCQPQVMGACLDLITHAADTLHIEANSVTDNPLVFPDTGEVITGGNFHAEPVAFAADMMAIALCEIGSLAERRIAMLVDPVLSGLPAFLTPEPGLNCGFMVAQVTAAALVSENKQRAYPASVDSIPTSANQEDHVSMATHGARRLLAMAENLAGVIGIELLAAAQGCDFHAPLRSSPPIEAVRRLLRSDVPALDGDRYFHTDMVKAIALVRSGAIVAAVGEVSLPEVTGIGSGVQ